MLRRCPAWMRIASGSVSLNVILWAQVTAKRLWARGCWGVGPRMRRWHSLTASGRTWRWWVLKVMELLSRWPWVRGRWTRNWRKSLRLAVGSARGCLRLQLRTLAMSFAMCVNLNTAYLPVRNLQVALPALNRQPERALALADARPFRARHQRRSGKHWMPSFKAGTLITTTCMLTSL